jgi:hypothetical protein
MKRWQRTLALVTTALTVAPLLYAALPEQEENRRRLEKLQNQPEELARLRRQARYFLTLPPARRDQLLTLDRDLHREAGPSQARLLRVLERYAAWLDRLDPTERQRIQDAPSKQARLDTVKKLREEEWIKRQPRAIRQELAKLEGDKRGKRLQYLRREERKRHQEWQLAARFWEDLKKGAYTPPLRLTDFATDVQHYVKDYLLPLLNPQEKVRLQKAEGHWPLYPHTLVTLADRYAPALPGHTTFQRWEDLPGEVQKKLQKPKAKAKIPPRIKQWDGRPELFPRKIAEWAQTASVVLPHELWPYSNKCLSRPVQEFVLKKLQPVLSAEEMLILARAEDKREWPEYPLTLKKLAENHNLQIPWHVLPGDPLRWDKYRLTPRLSR